MACVSIIIANLPRAALGSNVHLRVCLSFAFIHPEVCVAHNSITSLGYVSIMEIELSMIDRSASVWDVKRAIGSVLHSDDFFNPSDPKARPV